MNATTMRKSFITSPKNAYDSHLFWCWEYRAFLTLSTPLAVLKRHGERLFPSASDSGTPAMDESEMDYAAWEITEIADHEIGIQLPFKWDNVAFAMDIPDDYCLPERYFTFLMRFRSILESEGAPSRKRQATDSWLKREVWNDVLVCWGGAESFLNRVFPEFLLYIHDQGIPARVISGLRESAIISRVALSRITDRELLSISGVGKSIAQKLRSYQISEHSVEANDPYLQMIR